MVVMCFAILVGAAAAIAAVTALAEAAAV